MPNLDFQLVLDITVSHYLKKSIFMEKNQVIGKMTDIVIKRKPAMLNYGKKNMSGSAIDLRLISADIMP
jgi:hypothetical protein